MRHAEAVPDTGGDDHARPLTIRGVAQARAVPARLAAAGWLPERVISSDSARARETADGLLAVWGKSGVARGITWSRDLYLAGLAAIATLAETLDPVDTRTLLVLGHNPGFSEAAGLLGGRPVNLATGAAALLSIESESWAEALAFLRGWKLEQVMTP